MKERGLFPYFDCAYQGFASGSLTEDNLAIRQFVALNKGSVQCSLSPLLRMIIFPGPPLARALTVAMNRPLQI